MIDLGSLARQINRGSKSSEIVLGCAKSFASLETNVENTGERGVLETLSYAAVKLGPFSNCLISTALPYLASAIHSIPLADSTLKRMGLVAAHLSFQADAIQRGVQLTPEIEETLSSAVEKIAPVVQTHLPYQ